MLGKEVLTVDLCSLSAACAVRGLPNPRFEHVWCGLRLLQISGLRPSQSPIFFQWDSSYSRPSAKLAKQLESLTIFTR